MKRYEIKAIPINEELADVEIKGVQDAYKTAMQFYGDDIKVYESFFTMMLNSAGNVIGWCKISQGGVNSTIVDPKIIAKYAIDMLATDVIMVHNHPSGNTRPSNNDKNLTKKVKETLSFCDIRLKDHLIISDASYYSFASECIL